MLRPLARTALLALVAALAACAPATRGASPGLPLEAAVDQPARVAAGATWFVSHRYNPEYFGVTDAMLDDAVPINFGVRSSVGNVENAARDVNWIVLTRAQAPEGWEVTLARVTARRDVVRTENNPNSTRVQYREYLEFIYRVVVPAGAASGLRVVPVTVRQGTREYPLTLAVAVEAPGPAARN